MSIEEIASQNFGNENISSIEEDWQQWNLEYLGYITRSYEFDLVQLISQIFRTQSSEKSFIISCLN